MIEIASEYLSAAINPLGAELTSLRDAGGRELMTDADPAFWTGHAPILFPIVGRLNGDVLRIDGVDYPMKQHGFARRMMFELIEHRRADAIFRLRDTAETRAAYPFAFQLDVHFRVHFATLSVFATLTNCDDRPMPASLGFHPAFAWPLPYGGARDDHRIVFAKDEPGPVLRLVDGLVAGERASPLDGERVLRLDDALFADDALIWYPVRSHKVRYGTADGPGLEIDTGLPGLGIWTKPGARFVCIEPWEGHADRQGFTGDFSDKPGVTIVAPGAKVAFDFGVTLLP